ncbi:sialate O-acetylesterase [Peloplasma aerotolerans]|uniref:Sialate O-acetylesterase n=1 Tax=Peloplasma aerotolerans TaxID=3044389 RepID=A0AAW6U9I5_9MOLU|nr:sialate O-acetylesterase [Mariniplasma sp. M4Ah]MDI6452808.1 sialate O-acetylesterase [Mariniplasma sp. M4Ah]
MCERYLMLAFLSTLIILLTACHKTSTEVNKMMDALNLNLISTNDNLLTSMEPTFDIDYSVPLEKSRFLFEPIFSDSMVLQANAVIKFHGSHDTDGKIALMFNGQTYYSEVTTNQLFSFYIGYYTHGGPYEMTLYTKTSKYVFKDIMIGEVYLMSGQSNMAITMSQILNSANSAYTQKIKQDIDDIDKEKIRFITVGILGSSEPLNKFQTHQTYPWEVLSSDNALNVSATAFYFAQEILNQYDIPVGIIISAVGATYTNTWIPKVDAIGMDSTYVKNISDADTPSQYYNGMIAPLKHMIFRGVIWYQGEGQDVKYEENVTKLIHGWRREFSNPNLKFLIVGLPRFDFDLPNTQESWFQVRKQQQRLANIEGVTYSVNIDLGILSSQTNDPIHPYDKDLIGKRAAHAFMDAFYEAPGIWTSPRLIYAGYLDGKLILKFSNVGEGIYLTDKKTGFEVSSDGIRFSYAEPKLVDHETIELNARLDNVQAIRYGYSYSFQEVFGSNGQPGSLSELVCVFNSGHYPLDQFLIYT